MGTIDSHRANDDHLRNPSSDADEEPLSLSPEARAEGIRDSRRANDHRFRNPSRDAGKPPVAGDADKPAVPDKLLKVFKMFLMDIYSKRLENRGFIDKVLNFRG